jgi:surfactin synthase thioesterase subunit
LTRSAFIKEVSARYDGIPQQILEEPELLEFFLPVLRADLGLLESYRYFDERPLECPVRVFGGDEDSRVSRIELDSWRTETQVDFSVQMFRGGHFFINYQRHLVLQAIVDEVQLSAAA